ncbi:MAG: tripartite tricarboxylate transporter TctB family protein [Beijerinckiaceae bacterium]
MTGYQRWIELTVAAALSMIGLALATLAWRLPAGTEAGIPGPGTAPGFLGLALMACGLVILVKAAFQAAGKPDASHETSGAMRKPLTALALLIACALGLEPLGFILATFLFLSAGFILLGETPWRIALPAAAIGATGLWLFFTKLLGVGLPYGLIEQILFR